MHVAVIANPQVNCLLAPAHNAVELALQIEHQPVNKLQIVMAERGILNTQQVSL